MKCPSQYLKCLLVPTLVILPYLDIHTTDNWILFHNGLNTGSLG